MQSQAKARKFFSNHGRQPREDIVTSCVFGPLAYMPPEQAGAFLSWIIPERVELQGAKVEKVHFWPKSIRRESEDKQREPDVIVEMKGADGRALDLLVEVKWAGGQLGEDQARDQWRLFGPAAQDRQRPARVLHVFVVDNPATVREALANEAGQLERDDSEAALGWRDAQTVVGWFDAAARLRRRTGETGYRGAQRLAEDVASLLRELGKRPFEGFWRLPRQPVSAPSSPIFFGFAWPVLHVDAPEQQSPIFFSSPQG